MIRRQTRGELIQIMSRQTILTKAKKNIHNWFTLGLEEEHSTQYSALSEYNPALAKDNLESLDGFCSLSYLLLLLMLLSRCFTYGFTTVNFVPPLLAACGITLVKILLKQNFTRTKPVKTAYLLTGLFKVTWYAVAIYYDVFIQPDTPSVLSCLLFVLLTALFNTHPLDNILSALLGYSIMMALEALYVPGAVFRSDAHNILIALIFGVCINQKNTRTNIHNKLYMDMYKAATKTSILVSQVDLLHGTFEILQSPDYMVSVLSQESTAAEILETIGQKFVAPDFRTEYSRLLDLKTLPDRMEDATEPLNFYFLDFRKVWCQLIIVEQKRFNDKVSAVVIIVRDVNAEKQREFAYQKQLHEALEEAKLANASKTSFLRRMSHDVRTPINGILGMIEIADHYSDDLEKQREYRRKTREASSYLLSLVNSVLDMSKLESGTITLESVPFDLSGLLSEVNTVAEMQAIDHGIRFIADSDSVSIRHRYLIGSPVHLKQILQNLASNAIKYNRINGSVTVSCQEIASEEQTATFRFICSDTGLGMSEEFQKHAFEPFAQEGRKANTSYAGTGLGLSIVRELVECMGGTIELKSTLNEGSVFTVTLPLTIDHAPAAATQVLKPVDTLGKNALLVEDNDLNTEIALFLLEREGFTITRAVNGQDAVNLFAASRPEEYDIIFMDIMMPVMDGLAATRTIRAMNRPDAKTIPIIAMSANAFQDDVDRCYEAGMNAHVMKPIEAAKVNAAIQSVLRSTT